MCLTDGGMTVDAEEPELGKIEGMAEFEGEPIVGRTELTAQDFTAVWAILPQNRQIFARFALWILLIPLLGLIRAI